ncbi:VWA domain-containing protein [Halorhabdus salina]|uniref:VWA domain-containing protein n=1 Tax=Halorhabdus salina TaxID=2750670 RepID=UPI0015EF677F|nr:VWA domain-containing protein [Halorhabdus salina]
MRDRHPKTVVRGEAGTFVSFPGSEFGDENVTISPYPSDGGHDLPSVSPTVRISTENQPSGDPTVSLPLSSSVNASDFDDLAIYHWNANGMASGWQRVGTTVDEQSLRANATVSSLGVFTVLNETTWNESIRIPRPDTIAPENPEGVYVGTDNGTFRKVTTDSGETVWNRSLASDGETAIAADPNGTVYAATDETSVVSQFDWVDGSRSERVEFQRHIHTLTTAHSGSVVAAATGDRGGNVTLVDAERGYRPWTLIHFSKHVSDYNIDTVTEGTDGGIYAGLYFESRREPTRLVRLNRTALETPTQVGENDSILTRWETRLEARYINALQQRGDRLFVGTSTGVWSVGTENGTTLWSTPIDGGVSRIAFGPNGTVYATDVTDEGVRPDLIRLDPETGSVRTRTTLPLNAQTTVSDLTVGTDGTVYVGSETGAVYDPNAERNDTAEKIETDTSTSQTQVRPAVRERSTSSDQPPLSKLSAGTGNALRNESANQTTVSIQAIEQHITPDDGLTLQFSAEGETAGTIELETTSGQVLLQRSVTAITQPKQLSVSGLQPGEYVATIEAEGSVSNDSTGTITVEDSTSTGTIEISVQAADRNITAGETLILELSAEEAVDATLRLSETDGSMLLERSVTATTQTSQLSVPNLSAETYVATIEAKSGNASDSTEEISVTGIEDGNNTDLSVQAVDRDVTTAEGLVIRYSASQPTEAALTVRTTNDQTVLQQEVTASNQSTRLSIEDVTAGEYVVVLEALEGDERDTTEQITVSQSDGSAPTGLSIQALQTELTTEQNLTLDYSADGTADGQLRVATARGQTVVNTSVSVKEQTTRLTIPGLGAGEYVATLSTREGDLTAKTERITIESVGDPMLNVSAPPNEFTRSEPIELQIESNAQRNVTFDVTTTDGESVHNGTLSLPGGELTFRLGSVPAGTYVVTVRAQDANLTAKTDPVTIRVVNPQVSVQPSIARPGESITFASMTNESGRSDSIVETTWDFGDGTVETVEGAQTSHTYTEPGEYEVNVTIVDSFGGGNEYTVTKRASVGNKSEFIDPKGTVTAIAPNGSVKWQHETDAGVTALAETTGVGPETNPEGETTPIWSIDVPADNRTQIAAAVRVTGADNATGTFVAYNDDNNRTRRTTFNRSTWTTLRFPATEFAGEEITLSVRGSEGAQAEMADVRLLRHADDDRLPNYVEHASFKLPIGQGREVSLDPTSNDTDGDGVVDHREVYFLPANGSARSQSMQVVGAISDPTSVDTDEDGLTDVEERLYKWANPVLADTDWDGVSDPNEDVDDDGLPIAAEIENGTSPMTNDTDRDRLSDRAEIVTHGTDPTVADTDEDGLADGDELALPADPTDPDTDDDGTVDGNETYTSTTKNESVGVRVDLTGQGNLADGVTVGEQTEPFARGDRVANMSVSEIVEIESDRDFESATVTIEYDETLRAAENESDLAVMTYDPEKQLYVPLNSTVDPENNTVSAETEHFSTFAVFSVSNWIDDVTAHESPERGDAGVAQPVDVVFAIDSSGSMGDNDPNGFRKRAGTEFVGGLIEGDRAGVVDFDNSAHVDQSLTTDFETVNASVRSLDANGGTNIGNGISQANQHFASASNDSRAKVAILLTDGRGSGGRSQARTAADWNITIHAIGFGGANGAKLSDIAGITNGTYHYVDSASDLPEVFSRVAGELPEDSDGDGLPDVAETEGIPIGHAHEEYQTIETDPNDPDTDGDGIDDLAEVGPLISQNVTVSTVTSGGGHVSYGSTTQVHVEYRKLDSDPTKVDSDGDGLTDREERDGWETAIASSVDQANSYAEAIKENPSSAADVLDQETVTSDPFTEDTDGDGLDDLTERINKLHPRKADSDGDTLSDEAEHVSKGESTEFAPAIFDSEPPTVIVRSIVAEDVGRTSYDVSLRAADASGLAGTYLRKKGEEQYIIEGDGRDEFSYEVSFDVERGLLEKIQVGLGGFVTGTSVTIESYDIHGNKKVQTFHGADSFGQTAKLIGNAPLPGDVGKREGITLMSFSSGVTTSGKQAVVELVELVLHPVENANQMKEFAGYITNNPGVVSRIPEMMAEQIEDKQRTRNPFLKGNSEYDTFRKSWYTGYVTGSGISMAIGDKGSSAIVGRLSQSSTRIGRAMRALKSARASLKAGVSTRTMALAGRINGRLPDVDVDTGQIANRLSEVSQPIRQRTTRQLHDLDDDTWQWINDNGIVYKSASKATRVVRATGQTGKRALQELGTDGRAALLELSDQIKTERAILRAWERGEIDTGELASTLRRFDGMADDEFSIANGIVRRSDDEGLELLRRGEVCNSPCRKIDEVLDDIDDASMTISQDDVEEVGAVLSREVTDGEVSLDDAEELIGDIDSLASNGRDVTDLFTENPNVGRSLGRAYAAGDLDASHVRRLDELVDAGDMDSADVRRFSEMLEQRDSDALIDDSIEADDLLDVAQKDKLGETRLLTKRDGEVIRLQSGDIESGLEHIEGRHVNGNIVRRQQANGKDTGAASFFPTGRKIEVDGKTKELPDKMSDQDVQELIYETVEEGSRDPGRGDRIQYTLKPSDNGYDYGVERMKVIVNGDGSIHTGYPKSGSAVEKWSFPADDWV